MNQCITSKVLRELTELQVIITFNNVRNFEMKHVCIDEIRWEFAPLNIFYYIGCLFLYKLYIYFILLFKKR